jgi:hypothetical protein
MKSQFDLQKERTRQRRSEMVLEGRSLDPIPTVADPDHKEAARGSLRAFISTYFDGQDEPPEELQDTIIAGGVVEAGDHVTGACLWAAIFGHHDRIAIVAASTARAARLLDAVKGELEGNDLLLEDFPEVCFPIRSRCEDQTCGGDPTAILWGRDEIRLPTIEGSAASAATIHAVGETGRVNALRDAVCRWPSLVLVAD